MHALLTDGIAIAAANREMSSSDGIRFMGFSVSGPCFSLSIDLKYVLVTRNAIILKRLSTCV